MNEAAKPRFKCPYCGSTEKPVSQGVTSAGGWVLFVLLLLVCFPVCWLALFIQDQRYYCRSCRMPLGN